MLRVAALVLALTAGSALAKPVVQIRDPPPALVSFDFELHLNVALGGAKIADLDRARAASMIANLGRRDGSVGVTNTAVTYVADVAIGEPSTSYSLVVDTGSSITWLGANKTYTPTDSSVNTGKNVSLSYGSGKMKGLAYNDTVTLSSDLVIKQQTIGVANTTSGFTGYDGILGLGPVAITANTVDGMSTVPTVADNLFSQGSISNEVIAVSFAPTTSQPNGNGAINFGRVDSSKYSGEITYAPITKSSPASRYWGYDSSVTYGSSGTEIFSNLPGILDTGTTLVLVASDSFETYKNVTGATLDGATGLLEIGSDDYDKLESLYFEIGGTTFEMTQNAQTFPRQLNTYIGGSPDSIYLVIGDLGTSSTSGLSFINGYSFLERFYSVYDTTNQRIGVATTANTNSTSN